MSLWDPFREMERLRREMDRIYENVDPDRARLAGFLPGAGARRYPRVNVSETDAGFVVEALAPGVEPDAFDLSVKDNVLTIAGEKAAPGGVKAEAFHRSERAAGRFVRTLELPAEVDVSQVRASYVDGILRVQLAKSEEVLPRRIAIDVG